MNIIRIILLIFFATNAIAQHRIRVPANMLLQIHISIQPDDKSWGNWNMMPSLQDSTKVIRIDRMAQGYAPFIVSHDGPYYSPAQVKEIQISLEKILNPDGYFTTQEEYIVYCRAFIEKYVFVR